ncbi:hypothetical protein KUTeg_003010 [Tegillarca granosa]|uniref:Uncharacterized protein n=1 Tax=Tegillarca granosa TaxID=220873 RepID=A0ABQ9FKV5_TEGGR|nr:hypothetical protein KUTeg_003010 [Tegillarca granosa]
MIKLVIVGIYHHIGLLCFTYICLCVVLAEYDAAIIESQSLTPPNANSKINSFSHFCICFFSQTFHNTSYTIGVCILSTGVTGHRKYSSCAVLTSGVFLYSNLCAVLTSGKGCLSPRSKFYRVTVLYIRKQLYRSVYRDPHFSSSQLEFHVKFVIQKHVWQKQHRTTVLQNVSIVMGNHVMDNAARYTLVEYYILMPLQLVVYSTSLDQYRKNIQSTLPTSDCLKDQYRKNMQSTLLTSDCLKDQYRKNMQSTLPTSDCLKDQYSKNMQSTLLTSDCHKDLLTSDWFKDQYRKNMQSTLLTSDCHKDLLTSDWFKDQCRKNIFNFQNLFQNRGAAELLNLFTDLVSQWFLHFSTTSDHELEDVDHIYCIITI